MKIGIIGAGLGGLAAAARLAHDGHHIQVFEQNAEPGGKMNIIESDGFRFDTGPSLLTMPDVLRDVFTYCGAEMDEYLQLQPVDPICRYFYSDGTQFDCFSDLPKVLREIERIAPEDREAYVDFLGYSTRLYKKTAPAFLFNNFQSLQSLLNLNWGDFLKINPFKTVSQKVDQYFESPYLRQFFKRFTTYNGSSPFQAPATLNVIPYVELCLGGYYVKGGIYNIARSLYQLAVDQGAEFHFSRPVEQIQISDSGSRCNGIIDESGRSESLDIVISNSDVRHTYTKLVDSRALPKRVPKKHNSMEPSCSGFVLLLGIDHQYSQLEHHNVFFSSDYPAEFDTIFRQKMMPEDPTIYIANTSHSDYSHAPEGGSNLFILVNAPYLSDQVDWKKETPSWYKKIVDKLEQRGLTKLSDHIIYKKIITPLDFYDRYRSNRGSIYGTSSNDLFSAFMRPKNQSPHLENLFLVGGSSHPGGGIPLVLLSAYHACEFISE